MVSGTQLAYGALVALVAAGRGLELRRSSRNARRLLDRGGIECGAEHYPWMVAVHAGFLLACPCEVWALDRPWIPPLAATMLLGLAAAMALRYWTIATLGERWTTRVIYVPGEPLVRHGPFRWLRHPNYAAVAVELVALPLVHSAWVTAVVFGLANAAVLRTRIAVEDAALRRLAAPAAGGPR